MTTKWHTYGITMLLAGCASGPSVITKTITVEVPIEHVVPVPPALSADCVPAPLAGSTIEADLLRLAAVEDALHCARDQLARIRALPIP